jgi:hypothetical protein
MIPLLLLEAFIALPIERPEQDHLLLKAYIPLAFMLSPFVRRSASNS